MPARYREVAQAEPVSPDDEADLETALTKSGFGKFNVALIFLSFIASCTPGFESGVMSYVIPAASNDLDLIPRDKAMLQSASYAGMITSGLFWGFLSDALGRKKLLVVGFIGTGIMAILAATFQFVSMIVLFKFLSGFMWCGPYSIFAAYLSEVFLKKGRNLVLLSIGMNNAIGQMLQAGLATLIMPSEIPSQIPFKSWQVFQLISSLPALISGIGFIFFVESPKFLADKGYTDEALEVLQTIYSINTGNPRSSYPIKKLKHKGRDINDKSSLSKFLNGMEIFKPPFINKVVIMIFIHLGAVGLNNFLRLWLPEMLSLVSSSRLEPNEGFCLILQDGNLARNNLTSDEVNNKEVYLSMMMVNVGVLVGQICFLLVVTFVGKKTMEIGCAIVAGVGSFIIPLISAEYIIIPAGISFTLYNICIFSNLNIMVDIFPTRMRATSVSVVMLVARVGTFALNFIIADLLYDYCQYFFYGVTFYSFVMAMLLLLLQRKPIEHKLSNGSKLNGIKSSPGNTRNSVL